MRRPVVVWALCLSCAAPAASYAQDRAANVFAGRARFSDGTLSANPTVRAAASERPTGEGSASAGEPGGVGTFVRDVFRDYRNMLSLENAQWAAVGGVATLAIAGWDDELSEAAASPTPYALKPGSTYGNPAMQFPFALTWWIVGHAAGSARGADAGRDLVRAQISATSWTYGIKYAVGRTRPNGDPRSFPSGHASASFATAMVLQQHYGWKLGLPAFGAAAYTAVERVYDRKHWPSDVAFGALVGTLAGRTVTLQLRGHRVVIRPQAALGGGGVTIHVLQ